MTNLKHLRALCDAATDGEWFTPTPASPTPFVTSSVVNEFDICDLYHKADDGKIYTKENAEANARFIAATDPQTVRALIDEVERVTKQRNILRKWMIKQECYGASVDTDKLEQALKGTDNE